MTQEERLNIVFNNFLQQELHCVIMADILIGRIESCLFQYSILEKELDKKHPVFKTHAVRVDNLKRLLALSKIAYNSKKKWLSETFNEDDTYNSMLNISKFMDELFELDHYSVQSVYLAKDMMKKKCFPTYLDLSTSKLQELAKRTNLPLEYVKLVLIHIPDVIINE